MVTDLLVCGGSQPKNSYFVSSSWVGAKFPLCANLANVDFCNFMNIQWEQVHTSVVPDSTHVWSISSAKIWMSLFTTPFLLAIFNSLTVHLGIWDRNCIPSCSIVARIEASWGKAYLIFVIFLTWAKFLDNKIYTEKRQFFALNL